MKLRYIPLIIALGLSSCNEKKDCGSAEYHYSSRGKIEIRNYDSNCDGTMDRREFRYDRTER